MQFLVLGYAHRHAELTGNIGNLALLKLAGGLGLIPDPLAEAVHAELPGVPAPAASHCVCRASNMRGCRSERVGELVRPVAALWAEVFEHRSLLPRLADRAGTQRRPTPVLQADQSLRRPSSRYTGFCPLPLNISSCGSPKA